MDQQYFNNIVFFSPLFSVADHLIDILIMRTLSCRKEVKLETDVMVCHRELEADSKCLQETCSTIQQLETALEQCKEFINLFPKPLKKLQGQCVIFSFAAKQAAGHHP